MQLYYTAAIHERYQFESLVWLSVTAPGLARIAQPGQYALVRPSRSLDPLLWPVVFLAGADAAKGEVELIIDPRDPALAWLLDLPAGVNLDLCAPLGRRLRRRRRRTPSCWREWVRRCRRCSSSPVAMLAG